MGCASSAASSNQGPDAEAGEREGHRKERRSPRTEEPAPAPPH